MPGYINKRATPTDRPREISMRCKYNFFVVEGKGIQKKETVQRSPKSKIMISVRLTPYLKHEAERIARERGCTLSMAIRALLFYAVESIAAANSGEEPPPG